MVAILSRPQCVKLQFCSPGSLECDINEVENMLVALEDLCEQQDHHGNKLHHEHMLVQYKDKKNTELEQTKGKQQWDCNFIDICIQSFYFADFRLIV